MPMHTSISIDNEYLKRDKRGRKDNKGCTCMYIHYPLFIVHVHVHGYAYIHGHMHVHMHVECEYIPMPMPTSIPMDNGHLTRDKRGSTKNKVQ